MNKYEQKYTQIPTTRKNGSKYNKPHSTTNLGGNRKQKERCINIYTNRQHQRTQGNFSSKLNYISNAFKPQRECTSCIYGQKATKQQIDHTSTVGSNDKHILHKYNNHTNALRQQIGLFKKFRLSVLTSSIVVSSITPISKIRTKDSTKPIS